AALPIWLLGDRSGPTVHLRRDRLPPAGGGAAHPGPAGGLRGPAGGRTACAPARPGPAGRPPPGGPYGPPPHGGVPSGPLRSRPGPDRARRAPADGAAP